MLQCVAVCCSVLQSMTLLVPRLWCVCVCVCLHVYVHACVYGCVAVCCSVLQCVVVCCSVLESVTDYGFVFIKTVVCVSV